MHKIIGTVLELLGFEKADAETVIKLLAAHLTAEVALTVAILLLTVAAPILVTRPLADVFDRRAKARDRAERVTDITLAAYHEMFMAWKAMIESFGSDTALLDALLQRMSREPDYFPLYTFDDSNPEVFENYVKKDIAIFPSSLIGVTIEFYQSSQFFLAYLKDSRSDQVQKLSVERKKVFIRNVHSTAYEHMAVCCDALAVYEPWVTRCRTGALPDMSWLAGIEEIKNELARADVGLPSSRLTVYRNLSKKFNELGVRATSTDSAEATLKPAGELGAGT